MRTLLLSLFAAAAAVIAYQAISFLTRYIKTRSKEAVWCLCFAMVSALYAAAFIPLYAVESPAMSVVIRLVMFAGMISLGLYIKCMLIYFDSRSRILSLGSSVIFIIGGLYGAAVVYDLATGSNLLIAPKTAVGSVRSFLLPDYFINHYDILSPTRYPHAACRMIALASLVYLLFYADMKRDRPIQIGVIVSIICLVHNMITVSWAVNFFAPLLPFMNLIEITRLEWRARRGEELRLKSYEEQLASFHRGLNEHLKFKKIGEDAAKFIHDAINIAFITDTKLISAMHSVEKTRNAHLIEDVSIACDNSKRLLSLLTSGRDDYLAEKVQEVFEVEEAIDSALELTEHRLRSHDIKLIFEGTSKQMIVGDRTKLTQIFVNLINNACDAINNLAERWIQIEINEHTKHTVVSIANSGDKIPEALRDHIFRPFFTTKGKDGTGLGLKICRDNIEEIGGELSLNPSSEHTQFDVLLPNHGG